MKIFISYRRDDSPNISGRIYDSLAAHFGHENVFKDVDDIPFGVDFVTYLDDAVKTCDVLVAVIGDKWVDIKKDDGSRRLDDPNDFVRIEVESALKRDIPVIPLFVEGVTGLQRDRLPETLHNLSRRNGIPIRRDPDFHKDMDRLVRGLEPNSQQVSVPKSNLSQVKSELPTKLISPFDIDLAIIPAGPFLMGSAKDKDSHAYDDEFPQHSLTLREFAIGKTPVTNGQYAVFVADTDYEAPSHFSNKEPPKANHPVTRVNWHAAIAFCDWVSAKSGYTISLPSEAEWEKAARGADGRIYPWGNTLDKNRLNFLTNFLNYGDRNVRTTAVAKYSPLGDSPYGSSDMVGNVWEWTRSHYKEYPYQPDDGRESLLAGNDVPRVVRGGSYFIEARGVRCAVRAKTYPDFGDDGYGFRIVVISRSSL